VVYSYSVVPQLLSNTKKLKRRILKKELYFPKEAKEYYILGTLQNFPCIKEKKIQETSESATTSEKNSRHRSGATA
jgi:hypothetical protein